MLTLGGTADEAVEDAKHQAEKVLDKLGGGGQESGKEKAAKKPLIAKRGREKIESKEEDDVEPWRQRWKWSKVQGAAVGWWQILLQGIWVSGAKILRNQPVVLDVSFPKKFPLPFPTTPYPVTILINLKKN